MRDVVEEHFEELQVLWNLRRGAMRSPRFFQADVARLESRIEAHVDGLLVAGAPGLEPLIGKALAQGDDLAAFAAGYVLLRADAARWSPRVIDAMEGADAPRSQGLREAACFAPAAATALLPGLTRLSSAPEPSAASAAALEAMAWHRPAAVSPASADRLIRHDDPTVRRTGWRVLTRIGGARPVAAYEPALADEDAGVRAEALLSAAWAREPWVLERARALGRSPALGPTELLRMLGALGRVNDLQAVLKLLTFKAAGPFRFEVAASFGHPGVVDPVLQVIADESDPESAAAAGQAFERIVGIDARGNRRVPLVPPGARSFEAAFADEVTLPDVEKARAAWRAAEPKLHRASRLSRGRDVGGAGGMPDAATFAALDMQARFEARLRGRYEGGWRGSFSEAETWLRTTG